MPERRVVITGLGTVNPAGGSQQETWSLLRAGVPAGRSPGAEDARLLPRCGSIDVAGLPLRRKELSRMNRGDTLGVVAAVKAALDAGWTTDANNDAKGLFFGTAKDTSPNRDFLLLLALVAERGYAAAAPAMVEHATRYMSPFALLDCMPNLVLHYVSEVFKLRGDNCCFLHTGAAGSAAIIAAYRAIRAGRLTSALVGGFDSVLDRLNLARLAALGFLAVSPGQASSRPFDRRRDGFLPGEAGAAMVLEEREAALARGNIVYGEILGAGSAAEPCIEPGGGSGYAVARALKAALGGVPIEADALGFVVANGAGTPGGDRAEAAGIRAALGAASAVIPVTAVKGIFGHALGAAGPLDALAALSALAHGEVPPICGCEEPDESCGLRLIAGGTVAAAAPTAAIVSVGFGGQACALVLGKGDG